MPAADTSVDFDNLVKVIETLKERIENDPYSGKDETRTRLVFIDPLLQALGWDTKTRVVIAEYRIQPRRFRSKKADYALLKSPEEVGYPIAFIEAKRLNEELDAHLEQALAYADERKSVKHVCLTNGDQWKFYDVSDEAQPCRIFAVSVRGMSASECAKQLQPLMRPNLVPGGVGAPVPPSKTLGQSIAPEYPVRSPEPLQDTDEPALDMSTVLSWLAVGIVSGGILGVVFGFRAAQPVLEGFVGPVGAIVVVIAVIAAAVLVRPRLPWGLLWPLLWPLRGRTLRWAGGVVIVGLGIGYILGYSIGLQVGQPVYDLLAGVGTIVVGIVAFALVIGMVLLVASGQGHRRYSRKRNRYSRGRRR